MNKTSVLDKIEKSSYQNILDWVGQKLQLEGGHGLEPNGHNVGPATIMTELI